MNKRKQIITSMLTLGLLLAPMIGPVQIALAATTIYVDCDATGAGNGDSWADAYTDLQDALADTASGDEIWVAEGVYKPGSAGDRTATFQLKNGVDVYGGFAGTESSRDRRDWQAHVTVLSGDIDDNDTTNADGVVTDTGDVAGSNSYHVVTGSGTDSTATLDGFTITAGYAENTTSPHSLGGGMYTFNGSPELINLIFCGNHARSFGGGMYNTSASATLTNVTFSHNRAYGGGGMRNYRGNITLTNVTFSDNTASLGGGLNNYDSSPTLTNVTFRGNTASSEGGGMRNDGGSSPWLTNAIFSGNDAIYGGGMTNDDSSSPTLTNVTFSGNTATTTGGGMYNVSSSDPQFYNCILWGNSASSSGDQIANSGSTPAISYGLVQGGCPTGATCDHLLTADPQFIDADGADDTVGTLDDNLRLEGDSPAVDAGDNGWLTASTDLDYHVRRVDMPQADTGSGTAPIVDMGAYEAHVLYVDADATGGARDGSSWDDAYTDLQDALTAASAEIEIWVAEGNYQTTDETFPKPDREATFQLKNNVALYGGFAGTETARDQRDWKTHVTVLSGDIEGNDITDANGVVTDTADIVGDNAYHVVDGSATNSSAILDGFSITAGQANAGASSGCGGGMHADSGSPTLRNLILSGNLAVGNGGGVYSSGNPALTDVTFSANAAEGSGGGMYNYQGAPTLTGLLFSGNHATSMGGGLFNWGDVTLTNVFFVGNSADSNGGGMENYEGSLTLTNGVFSGNTANTAGGVFNYKSDVTVTNVTFSRNTATLHGGGMLNYEAGTIILTNCILWQNSSQIRNMAGATSTVSYSLVQWGCPSGSTCDHLLTTDPQFVDDDLRLGLASPAIDAGDNSAVPGNVTTDIAGSPRFFDAPSVPDTGNGSAPVVDMGAYEARLNTVYLPLVLRG